MAKKIAITKEEDILEPQVYELSFHIISSISEDEANTVVGDIKAVIAKNGGEEISSVVPERFELEYPMSKSTTGKKQWFENSFFGHIIFRVSPSSINSITKDVKAMDKVLRFLTISLPPEALLPRERRVAHNSKEGERAEESAEEVAALPISEEEVDKAIEKMVAN